MFWTLKLSVFNLYYFVFNVITPPRQPFNLQFWSWTWGLRQFGHMFYTELHSSPTFTLMWVSHDIVTVLILTSTLLTVLLSTLECARTCSHSDCLGTKDCVEQELQTCPNTHQSKTHSAAPLASGHCAPQWSHWKQYKNDIKSQHSS